MSTFQTISNSEAQTQRLGVKLARCIKRGDCVALVGDFGSGKTVFVRGLARGLGVKKNQYVASPSFVILKIYQGRLAIHHFDLYRLSHLRDFEDIGLLEFLGGEGVSVVEWAQRLEDLKIPWTLKIEFSVLDSGARRLKFFSADKSLKRLLKL